MFDYKGYTEEKLIELCDEEKANKGKARWRFWTSEIYSSGEQYRKYSGFPMRMPLFVYSDHGVGDPVVFPHELENNAEAMLVFCEEKLQEYKKLSKKPCYLTKAPFILYRQREKIEQISNAKGTLAFAAHSTPEIESEFDINKYIEQLKALPDDMQPVCVCLHMHDINKGQHKIFLENGIPVYTAGNASDIRYAERFYDILKKFKYTCSNLIGSYTYYSVEMGIPFSLFGEECAYWNKADKNFAAGRCDYETELYLKAKKIFSGVNKEISLEQRDFVLPFACAENSLSKSQMACVFWQAYLKNSVKKIFASKKYNFFGNKEKLPCKK